MKGSLRFFLAMAVLAVCGSPSAQEMEMSVAGGADLYSQYINRGYVVANKVVMQPTATLRFGDTGMSFNLWGSVPAQNRSRLDVTDQLNLTLGFDRTYGEEGRGVAVSLGYIQYTFPQAVSGSKHSEEIYAGIGSDHRIAPRLTVYYDFGLADGAYVTAGVSPSFPVNEEGTVSLGLGALAAFSNVSGRSFGFHNLSVSASVGITSGRVTLAPAVEYVYADDDVNPDNGEVRGGLKVRFNMF